MCLYITGVHVHLTTVKLQLLVKINSKSASPLPDHCMFCTIQTIVPLGHLETDVTVIS